MELWSKSMDWFLYDSDLCHERVKEARISGERLNKQPPPCPAAQ